MLFITVQNPAIVAKKIRLLCFQLKNLFSIYFLFKIPKKTPLKPYLTNSLPSRTQKNSLKTHNQPENPKSFKA